MFCCSRFSMQFAKFPNWFSFGLKMFSCSVDFICDSLMNSTRELSFTNRASVCWAPSNCRLYRERVQYDLEWMKLAKIGSNYLRCSRFGDILNRLYEWTVLVWWNIHSLYKNLQKRSKRNSKWMKCVRLTSDVVFTLASPVNSTSVSSFVNETCDCWAATNWRNFKIY